MCNALVPKKKKKGVWKGKHMIKKAWPFWNFKLMSKILNTLVIIFFYLTTLNPQHIQPPSPLHPCVHALSPLFILFSVVTSSILPSTHPSPLCPCFLALPASSTCPLDGLQVGSFIAEIVNGEFGGFMLGWWWKKGLETDQVEVNFDSVMVDLITLKKKASTIRLFTILYIKSLLTEKLGR